MNHQTIQSSIVFKGVGIHSGKEVTCTLFPATQDDGICFVRTDISHTTLLEPAAIGLTALRATRLGADDSGVSTPEHLLAALSLCGVTCCRIEIDGYEVPIMDGSSKPFVDEIHRVGVLALEGTQTLLGVSQTHKLVSGKASLTLRPYDGFKIEYTTQYPNSFLGSQTAVWDQKNQDGCQSIAPARTYAFTHEIEALQKNGLGLGGSLENVLLIGPQDFENEPRFDTECPRHKILDIMGDFSILGRPIKAEVIAESSGHQLNLEMVQLLHQHYGT